ncbi:MAG: protein kinase [Myxococcota bacterium]|nr:protein kinase [Myxococcota bacterium]
MVSFRVNASSQLGPYELIRRIGIGGMAEIYLAKTTGIGGFEKYLALKVIHPKFVEDQDFIDMLIDEAKIAVQLTHTNVGQIFDLGCIDETYFIAMEYVDGKDLYQLTVHCADQGIQIPFDVVAFIGKEIASGLHYAHGKADAQGHPLNLIHRDVSPQNVLLSYEGQVKIVDFGIAKATQRRQQTESGVIKGKFHYMAPEQAWGDALDGRSDVFSAGICLYEMVAGEMLYHEERALVLLDKVRKADIPNLREKRPDIPPQLEAIIAKALARDRDDRFKSAGEFHGALSAFLYGQWPSFSRHQVGDFLRDAFSQDAEKAPTVEEADPSSSAVSADASEPLMQAEEFDRTIGRSVIFSLNDLHDPEAEASSLDNASNSAEYADHDQTIASSYVLDGIPPEYLAQDDDQAEASVDEAPSSTEEWDESVEKTELLDTSIFQQAAEGRSDLPDFDGSSDGPTSLFDQPVLAQPKTLSKEGEAQTQNVSKRSAQSRRESMPPPRLKPASQSARSARVPRQNRISNPERAPAQSMPPTAERPKLEDLRREKARAKILEAHIPSETAEPRQTTAMDGRARQEHRKVARVTTRTTLEHRTARGAHWRGFASALKTPQGVTVIALFALSVYAITTFLPNAIEPTKQVVNLRIDSQPVGARIVIDGQQTGRLTNATLPDFEIGRQHTVRVELEGYEAQVKVVTIRRDPMGVGEPTSLHRFFLRRSKGIINVTSSPPVAEIYLDGRYVGTTPMVLRDQDRRKDERLLLVRKDGFKEKKAKLVWGEQERLDFNATLEPLRPKNKALKSPNSTGRSKSRTPKSPAR